MDEHGFDTLKLPFKPDEWRDADERIFHACFTILGQFVENELGTKPWRFGDEESEMHRGYRPHFVGDDHPKAIDLWLWYRDELPKLEEDYARDLNECYSGEFKTRPVGDSGMREVVDFGRVKEPKYPHDYPDTVKHEKLAELMAIRTALWT